MFKKNMYCGIKSCVSVNSVKTDFFVCNKGLRQGKNLSPIVFCLFLNDLDNYITQNNVNNLKVILYSYLILKKMNERITDS